jgi:hypothetical protein
MDANEKKELNKQYYCGLESKKPKNKSMGTYDICHKLGKVAHYGEITEAQYKQKILNDFKNLIEKHENINKETQNELLQEKEFIKNYKPIKKSLSPEELKEIIKKENDELYKLNEDYKIEKTRLEKKKNNYCSSDTFLAIGQSSLASALKRFDEKLYILNKQIKNITDTKTYQKGGNSEAHRKQLEKIKVFEDEINNEIKRLDEYSNSYERNTEICNKIKNEIKINDENYYKKTLYGKYLPLTKKTTKQLLRIYEDLINEYDIFYKDYNILSNSINEIKKIQNNYNYEIRELEKEKNITEDILNSYKRPPKKKVEDLKIINDKLSNFYNELEAFNKTHYLDKLQNEYNDKHEYFKNYVRRIRLIEKILNLKEYKLF